MTTNPLRTLVQRQAEFDKSLEEFVKHFEFESNDDDVKKLRCKLEQVTETIRLQEKRILCGLAPLPSDVRVHGFDESLIAVLKDVGWWKSFPKSVRDMLRKRLDRHGSTIPHKEGRPSYPYAGLEKEYADAIIEALNQSPKVKRLRERSVATKTKGQQKYYSHGIPYSQNEGKYSGPALELLEAALNLALPATGAGNSESRVKRLNELFR